VFAFTATEEMSGRTYVSLYLDNVPPALLTLITSRLKKSYPTANLRRVNRNSSAQLHAYVDQRRLLTIDDDEVSNAEDYGIFLKYVVHE
jgi:hypothetical protein